MCFALLIHSLFISFTAEGASNDYRVIASPPPQITSVTPTAEIALIIESDNVALEGREYFNVTLDITNRLGTGIPQFDGTARNEFFLNNLQVFIVDVTSKWSP